MAEDKPQENVSAEAGERHPLAHRWALWFDNPHTKQTMNKYGQTLKHVYSFDTVEDFWW